MRWNISVEREENQHAERKFEENMKQLQEQSRIEGIKLRIKEEIGVLQDRKRSVQLQYSKLSNSAVKEKKEIEAYIDKFDLEINELNKKYQLYDNKNK